MRLTLTHLALHAGLLFSYASVPPTVLSDKALTEEDEGGRRALLAPEGGEYEYSVELVKDIWPGDHSSKLHGFVNYKGKVFFTALTKEGGEGTMSLWKTDGTTNGTQIVKEHFSFDYDYYQELFGENFWYYGQLTTEYRFFNQKYVSNDKIYWRAESRNYGVEVWASDGTSDGTNMLKDIMVGPEGSSYGNYMEFVPFKGKTYFVASDSLQYPGNAEIWVTDGSTNGTHIQDITPDGSSFPSSFIPLSDKLLFRIGYELWYTDGSKDNAVKQQDFGFDTLRVLEISDPLHDQVFLCIENVAASYGLELWVTEGINHIPKLLKTLHNKRYIRFLDDLKLANGKVPFVTSTYDNFNVEYDSIELWATDGSVDGTIELSKFNDQLLALSSFAHFGSLNRTTFIAEKNEMQGSELWETDGTPEGTKLFKEFFYGSDGVTSLIVNPVRQRSTNVPENGFMLYYLNAASDPEGDPTGQNNTGWSLWVSDGSVDGTIPLNFTSRVPIVHELSSMAKAILNKDVTLFEAEADGLGAELWKVTRKLKTPCDDSSIRFKVVKKDGRKITRDCEWVKTKATKSRCELKGVEAICAKTCGACSLCADSYRPLRVRKDGETIFRRCNWVKKDATSRCELPGINNACRLTCGKCQVG